MQKMLESFREAKHTICYACEKEAMVSNYRMKSMQERRDSYVDKWAMYGGTDCPNCGFHSMADDAKFCGYCASKTVPALEGLDV